MKKKLILGYQCLGTFENWLDYFFKPLSWTQKKVTNQISFWCNMTVDIRAPTVDYNRDRAPYVYRTVNGMFYFHCFISF